MSFQGLLYSFVASFLAISCVKSEHNADDLSAEAGTAAELFCSSSLLCVYAAIIAIWAKRGLSSYLRRKGWSLVERCRDRQRKFDALQKWRPELCYKLPMVILLIGLSLLTCATWKRVWYTDSPVLNVLIFLAVPGVVVCPWIVIAAMSHRHGWHSSFL